MPHNGVAALAKVHATGGAKAQRQPQKVRLSGQVGTIYSETKGQGEQRVGHLSRVLPLCSFGLQNRAEQTDCFDVYLRLWMEKTAGDQLVFSHSAPGKRGPSFAKSYAGGNSARPAHRQTANQSLQGFAPAAGLHLGHQRGGIQFTPFAALTPKCSYPEFF